MRFWSVGYWGIGFWSLTMWAPGSAGAVAPSAGAASFAPPATRLYTVQAGQTTGGPSGGGTPYTVTSK